MQEAFPTLENCVRATEHHLASTLSDAQAAIGKVTVEIQINRREAAERADTAAAVASAREEREKSYREEVERTYREDRERFYREEKERSCREHKERSHLPGRSQKASSNNRGHCHRRSSSVNNGGDTRGGALEGESQIGTPRSDNSVRSTVPDELGSTTSEAVASTMVNGVGRSGDCSLAFEEHDRRESREVPSGVTRREIGEGRMRVSRGGGSFERGRVEVEPTVPLSSRSRSSIDRDSRDRVNAVNAVVDANHPVADDVGQRCMDEGDGYWRGKRARRGRSGKILRDGVVEAGMEDRRGDRVSRSASSAEMVSHCICFYLAGRFGVELWCASTIRL